jgi:hypothetical protein
VKKAGRFCERDGIMDEELEQLMIDLGWPNSDRQSALLIFVIPTWCFQNWGYDDLYAFPLVQRITHVRWVTRSDFMCVLRIYSAPNLRLEVSGSNLCWGSGYYLRNFMVVLILFIRNLRLNCFFCNEYLPRVRFKGKRPGWTSHGSTKPKLIPQISLRYLFL